MGSFSIGSPTHLLLLKFFSAVVSYADDVIIRRNCNRGAVNVLGVRISTNQSQPVISLPAIDNNSRSTRIVRFRLLTPMGSRPQLNPVSTMCCGRLLNRILGIMFRSTSLELPAEIRHIFRFGRFIFQ